MDVLIAEDEPVCRKIILRSLDRWGYSVISTSNGHDAYSILQQEDSPQLALLDWMMPGINGVELCRKLRKIQDTRHAPLYLIMLTHREEPNDIIEGLDAGADDYIVKPFEQNELKARLNVGRRLIEIQNKLMEQQKLHGALEMAGAICHEMNQPLQIISSYCEILLQDQHLNKSEHAMMRHILDGASRLGDMTRRIMNLSDYKSKEYINGKLSITDIDHLPEIKKKGKTDGR